jgi:hypothetical protein
MTHSYVAREAFERGMTELISETIAAQCAGMYLPFVPRDLS